MNELARLSSLLLAGGLMVGCNSMFRSDDGIDVHRLPDGREVIADTPRMWADWQETVEFHADLERQGQTPSGGGTWNQFWEERARALRSGSHQNPEKYVGYMIERRRQLGLPEIVGSN